MKSLVIAILYLIIAVICNILHLNIIISIIACIMMFIELSESRPWFYRVTIGRLTLSECPKYKPQKVKIVSTTCINDKNEICETIIVKVYYLFFWWSIKCEEVGDYDMYVNVTRKFSSIEEAKIFLQGYMKPVKKIYNLA